MKLINGGFKPQSILALRKTLCVLTFPFILLLSGCDKTSEISSKDDDTTSNCYKEDNVLNFFQIGIGALSGNENIPKQSIVVNNQKEWADLIVAMNSTNNVSKQFTEIDIAFETHIVLAVFDSVRPTLGYRIAITKIAENENTILVTVDDQSSGGDSQMVSQPFHIVKVCKTTKSVVFEFVK